MSQNNGHKNPERVAAGYKGTLNNPTAGKEAKEAASQRLHEYSQDKPRAASKSSSGLVDGFDSDDEYVPGRDDERTGLGDYIGGTDAGMALGGEHAGKNKNNVIGGYKATLNNPNTGEEAKQHAREFLEEHGVEQ
ncbi:Conidiation protein 6-domain-containing protein [Schizophyllum fasciatum]